MRCHHPHASLQNPSDRYSHPTRKWSCSQNNWGQHKYSLNNGRARRTHSFNSVWSTCRQNKCPKGEKEMAKIESEKKTQKRNGHQRMRAEKPKETSTQSGWIKGFQTDLWSWIIYLEVGEFWKSVFQIYENRWSRMPLFATNSFSVMFWC